MICVCVLYIYDYMILCPLAQTTPLELISGAFTRRPHWTGAENMSWLISKMVMFWGCWKQMWHGAHLFQANSANSWTFFGCAGPVLTLRLNHGRFWGGSVDPPRSPGWIPAVLPRCVLVQSLGSSAKYWDWMLLFRVFLGLLYMIPIIP